MEELRVVHVHVCVSFPDAWSTLIPLLTFFSFSLISIMSTGKEQTIIAGIYVFSAVLNISKVCHWRKYYICSLGVNFLQNYCWYRAIATRAPNSLLQLTIIVGMVCPGFQNKLSDIKVVFEDFFDFYREREKTKKWKAFEWENFADKS